MIGRKSRDIISVFCVSGTTYEYDFEKTFIQLQLGG